MFEYAENGVGADRPYLTEFKANIQAVIGGNDKQIEDIMAGLLTETSLPSTTPPKNGEGWYPLPDQKVIKDNAGNERYMVWQRPRTEKEKVRDRWQFMKAFLPAREWAGGNEDPLFFMTDTEALAKVPEEDIAILKYVPVPGAMGTQESALGEWRTYSSNAVKLVGEERPKTASPDFGYSQFNDRDAELSQVEFSLSHVEEKSYQVDAKYDGKEIAWITCHAEKYGNYPDYTVEAVNIMDKTWRGTGLGQMLYDHAIQEAKNREAHYFYSDLGLSPDARRAWQRLKKRYPVENKGKSEAYENYNPEMEGKGLYSVPRHRIDLTKVASTLPYWDGECRNGEKFDAPLELLAYRSKRKGQWQPMKKMVTAGATDLTGIASEYLKVLDPTLPIPTIKIVNQTGSSWLGRCKWDPKVDPNNTTIEIQKSILEREELLHKVMAHEVCHHVDYLVNYKNLPSTQKQRFEGHGPSWTALAAKINARYGHDFVTETSDAPVESLNPFFLAVKKSPRGYGWAYSVRPSAKNLASLQRHMDGGARLFKSNDHKWVSGPRIGSGFAIPLDADVKEALAKIYEEGEQVPIPGDKAEKTAAFRVCAACESGDCFSHTSSEDKVQPPSFPDSPAFKLWFGNSKVVNPDGTPRIAYHGTSLKEGEQLDSFDPKMRGKVTGPKAKLGFYFSFHENDAKFYSSLSLNSRGRPDWTEYEPIQIPVYLKIEHPYLVPTRKKFQELEGSLRQEDLKAKGHDGIIVQDGVELIVFEPNQIKSIKSVDFNPEDHRITAATPNPLKRWFGKSKVVDAKGQPLVVYHGSFNRWVPSFDMGREGTGSTRPSKMGAIWFTSERNTAEYYTNPSEDFLEADPDSVHVYGREPELYASVTTKMEFMGDPDDYDDDGEYEATDLFQVGPYPTRTALDKAVRHEIQEYNKNVESQRPQEYQEHVVAAYLRILNPLIVTVVPRSKEFEQARSGGHDGIIAKDVVDGDGVSDVFVVFNPNQIKSVDSVGFNPDDHRIRASKTAAPRGVYFHGSSVKNLRSILKQGLIPDPEGKNFGEDIEKDNHISLESYGGVYVTQNILTAISTPKDHYELGAELIVCMDLQPNTFYADEDSITGFLGNALGRLTDHPWSVLCAYIADKYDNDQWRESIEEYKAKYVKYVISMVNVQFQEKEEEMPEGLVTQLTTSLLDVWPVALARLAARDYATSADYDVRRGWTQVMGGDKYDECPPRAQLIPSRARAEVDFRNVVEKMTRTMKSLTRVDAEGKQQSLSTNARLTTPVGYSGSNHIVAVLEVRNGKQYREDNGPVPLIVHYGTVPEEFKTQWKQRMGSELAIQQSKTAAQVIPGATIVAQHDRVAVYTVQTPEALMHLSLGSDWGFARHVDEADEALEMSAPLYLFQLDGRPYAWYNMEYKEIESAKLDTLTIQASGFIVVPPKEDILTRFIYALKHTPAAKDFTKVLTFTEALQRFGGSDKLALLLDDLEFTDLLTYADDILASGNGESIALVMAEMTYRWPEAEDFFEAEPERFDDYTSIPKIVKYCINGRQGRWEAFEPYLLNSGMYIAIKAYSVLKTDIFTKMTQENWAQWLPEDFNDALTEAVTKEIPEPQVVKYIQTHWDSFVRSVSQERPNLQAKLKLSLRTYASKFGVDIQPKA
jgi:GNAT superfamily N-acetyltransferase